MRVIYSTQAFQHKNPDFPSKQFEREFESLERAKNAPFPDGCNFAHTRDNDGIYVRKLPYPWEFCPTD